jgi:transcriptional regulator with XRE-family HTH domain
MLKTTKSQARLRLLKSDDFDLCNSCNLIAASPLGSAVRPHSISLIDDAVSPTREPISARVRPVPRRSEMREAHEVMGPSLRRAVDLSQRPSVTVIRNTSEMARPKDLPTFTHLGPRIAYWRAKRQLSRTDLGEKVDLAYSTIADLEDERSNSTKALYKFAAALRVNLHYLETDEGDPESDPPPPLDIWPLPGIPREKLEGLDRVERRAVESAIKEVLAEIEEDRRKHRKSA